MRSLTLVSTFVVALGAALGAAQPQGGVLRVRLTNGTDGGPGSAEKVTLFRLSTEMVPVAELGNVSGSFEISDIVVEGERPMLLQVTSSGVNYNQPVRFGRGYEAEADLTVFDTFREWDDDVLEVTTSRFLYRRKADELLVDKVFVVENRSSPPRTYHDPNGTFRFNLPAEGLLEVSSVQASSTSGMPVPQKSSRLPSGQGYVTKTAFKPGETQISVSYTVDYSQGHWEVDGQSFYKLRELMVFVSPPDVEIRAEGWEDLGAEPEGRFAAVRKRDVTPGTPIRLELKGGSPQAPDLVSSSENAAPAGSEDAAQAGSEAADPHGTITRIPDTTRSSKWVIVILMAAALGYGLLSKLYPRTEPADRAERAERADEG